MENQIASSLVDLELFHQNLSHVNKDDLYGYLYLRNTEKSTTFYRSNEDLAIIFYNNVLRVYGIPGKHKLQEFVFQSKNIKLDVNCIAKFHPSEYYDIEKSSSRIGFDTDIDSIHYNSLLLVSLIKNNAGEIHVIDMINGKTVCSFEVPFIVLDFLPIKKQNNSQSSIISHMKWPVILSTYGGGLYLIDMYFDDELRTRYSEEVSREDWDNWDSKGGYVHGYTKINADYFDGDYFYYPMPKEGEFLGEINKNFRWRQRDVIITSLNYIESVNCIVVGFNTGLFQVWSLNDLSLVYCSPEEWETPLSISHIEHIFLPQENSKYKRLLLFVGWGGTKMKLLRELKSISLALYIIDFDSTDSMFMIERAYIKLKTQPFSKGRFISFDKTPDEKTLFFSYEIVKEKSQTIDREIFLESFDIDRVKHINDFAEYEHTNVFYNLGLASKNTYSLDIRVSPPSVSRNQDTFNYNELDVTGFLNEFAQGKNPLSFDIVCLTENGYFNISYQQSQLNALKYLYKKPVKCFTNPSAIDGLIDSCYITTNKSLKYSLFKHDKKIQALLDIALFFDISSVIIDYIEDKVNIYNDESQEVYQNEDFSLKDPKIIYEWVEEKFSNLSEISTNIMNNRYKKNKKSTSEINYLNRICKWLTDLYDIFFSLTQRYKMTTHTAQGVESMENTLNQILLYKRSVSMFIFMNDYDLINKKPEFGRAKGRGKTKSKPKQTSPSLMELALEGKFSKLKDIKQLVEIVQSKEYKETQKNSLLLYYLFDILQNEESFEDIIEDFCITFNVPLHLRLMIKGIWLFDQRQFEESCNIFCDPSVIANTNNNLSFIILNVFYDEEYVDLALQYYLARNPDIISIDDCILVLNILLSKNLYHDAFLLQRVYTRSAQNAGNKECLNKILGHIITTMKEKKILGTFFKFPLDDTEQSFVIDYLKSQKDDLSKEILLLFYLQRNQFEEAFEYFKDKSVSKDKNLVTLMNNYYQLVPEFKRNSNPMPKTKTRASSRKETLLETPLRRSKRLAKAERK